MPVLYLLDVPEYSGAADAFERTDDCRVARANGYVRIESDADLVIDRANTNMNEAVWFGLAVAGFEGEIKEFTSDRLRIGAAEN